MTDELTLPTHAELDELGLAEREWAEAQTDATIIIWALKHADSLITAARAGLEAGKAEESMREKAAKAGYYVCAKTRHISLGDDVYAAIRALPLTGADNGAS